MAYRYRAEQLKAPDCIFDTVCELLGAKVRVYVDKNQSRYFFPADRVESIFTECSDIDAAGEPASSSTSTVARRTSGAALALSSTEKISISDILKCSEECQQCKLFSVNHARLKTVVSNITSKGDNRSVRLVALLCWIGTPHLIEPLYSQDVHDKDLDPNSDKLLNQLDDLIKKNPNKDYFPAAKPSLSSLGAAKTPEQKTRDFNNFKVAYKDSVSCFYLLEFPHSWNLIWISPEQVLPITDITDIGAGSFGKVDSFSIYPLYDKSSNLPSDQKPKKYARKRIPKKTPNESVLDDLESITSEQAQTLNNPSIIRFHCAYQDAEYIYLIFDYVPHTLQKLFDNANNLPRSLRLGKRKENSLLDTRLWQGMEGIIRALDDLHNKDHNRVGIHRDLKPINILVDDKGTFFICDFGLSYFSTRVKNPHYWTSGKVPANHAEDGMYAPPPFSFEAERVTRTPGAQNGKDDPVYDIWSLACIMIELLVFLAGFKTASGSVKPQSEGVKEFREARCLEPGNTRGRFWFRPNHKSEPRICMTVEKVLKDIPARNDQDIYLQGIITIIRDMLKVKTSERLISGLLVSKINQLKEEISKNDSSSLCVPGRNPLDIWVEWYLEDHKPGSIDQFFPQKSDNPSDFTIYNIPSLSVLSGNPSEYKLRAMILARFKQLQFRNDHQPNRLKGDRILYLSLAMYKDEEKKLAQLVPDHEFSYRKEERVYPLHLYNNLLKHMFSFNELRPSYRFHIEDRKAFYNLLFHRLIGIRLLSDDYGSLSQLRFDNVQIYRSQLRKTPLESVNMSPILPDAAPVSVHIWMSPGTTTKQPTAPKPQRTWTGLSARSEVNIASSSTNGLLKKAPKGRVVIFRPTVPDYLTIPFEELDLDIAKCKKSALDVVITPGKARHGGKLGEITCFRFLPRGGQEYPSVPTDLDVLAEEEQKMQRSRPANHIDVKSIVITFKTEEPMEGSNSDDRSRFITALRWALGFRDNPLSEESSPM